MKGSGLGDLFFIGGMNVSGDINSLSSVSGGNTPIDVTAINQSGVARLGGQRTGAMDFVCYHNTTAGQIHSVLAALPTADVIATYLRGSALGTPAASINAKQLDYSPKRAANGALTIDVKTLSNSFGLEWGLAGTAGVRTDSAATNGSGFDSLGSLGIAGVRLYVHLLAFTGTSVTIKLQESNDIGGVDPWADITGATTGALTVAGATRIATVSGTKQFLRVVTTGTFSNAQFVANVVPTDYAVGVVF
jgi:hypothetical protein